MRASVCTTSTRCSSSSASHTGAAPFGGSGVFTKLSSSCTFTSLFLSYRSLVFRSLESTKKSIGDSAGAHQLREGGQRCVMSLGVLCVGRTAQVSPLRRDQGARAVGQHEHEMQP